MSSARLNVSVSNMPPHRADLVGRPKDVVVDDGAAAEAGAGQDADALVVGRGRAPAVIEAAQAVELGAVEVRVLVVASGLEHDDIETRPARTAAATPPPAPDPATQTSQSSVVSPTSRSGASLGSVVTRRPSGPG